MKTVLALLIATTAAVAQQTGGAETSALDAVRADREQLLRKAESITRTVEGLEITIQTYEDQIAVLKEEISEQEQVNAELQQNWSAETEKKIALAGKLKELQEQFAEIEETLKDRNRKLYEQRVALEKAEIKLKEAGIVTEAVGELRSNLEACRTELATYRSENVSLREQLAAAGNELTKAKDRVERLETVRRERSGRMSDLEVSLANLEADLTACRETNAFLSTQIDIKTRAMRALREDLEAAQVQLADLRDSREQDTWENAVLKSSLVSLRQEMETAMAESTPTATTVSTREMPIPTSSDVEPAAQAPDSVTMTAAETIPEVKPAMPLHQRIAEANRYISSGQFGRAEEIFRETLEVNPRSGAARLGLASSLYAQGDLAGAKNTVDRLLADEPRNGHALGLRGLIAYHEREMETAFDLLDIALQVQPDDARLHNYMGMVLHKMGRDTDAVNEFRQAVALNPAQPEARINLALLLVNQSPADYDTAREHYDAALRNGARRDPKLEQLLYP